MSDLLCVTNRTLCRENFLTRIEKIAAAHPRGIILREKDLTEDEYLALAAQTAAILKKYDVYCILHTFYETAQKLENPAIHLPLPILRHLSDSQKAFFSVIGASCHSLSEAKEAERLGCTYITAGHIFATDCKKGLPGRGVDFLQEICAEVSVPVYAIGGINDTNIHAVRETGAKGACIMSGLMQCDDAAAYLKKFEKAGESHAV